MAFVYILHSKTADLFYVGSTTITPEIRRLRHLNQYYGKRKFTAKYNDWELYFWFTCDSIHQAKKVEQHIKRMKSKKYIRNVKRYPEIHQKLLQKFS